MINNLVGLVGGTPLYEITSYPLREGIRLFAKLEFMNVGGSIKDRLGFYLLQQAFENKKINKGDTIIEATAGNTGIGLALAAIHYQLEVIFVTPKKFSIEKQTLMKALGAKVINTPTELGMKEAIKVAEEMEQRIPHSYIPNQFANDWNPDTYYHTLGPEVWNDVDGQIDIFVAGAGSGGTFTGTARYLKEQNPLIKTMIVEPEGSILSGGKQKPHKTEGIGMEFLPDFIDEHLFDEIYTIPDEQAFLRLKEVAKQEGLLVGSSSGAALEASLQVAHKAKAGTNIVTVFPDSSERYLSTGIYDN